MVIYKHDRRFELGTTEKQLQLSGQSGPHCILARCLDDNRYHGCCTDIASLSFLFSCFKGHKNVNRAIIHVDEAQGDTYKLLVEGDDLLSVMSTVGQF